MNGAEENLYAESLFQLSESGTTDFYPWGGFGRGYVTAGRRQRDELRKVSRWSYLATIAWVILFCTATGALPALAGSGLALVGLHVWYYRAIRKILADAPAAGPYPWRKVLRKHARNFSPGSLWALLVLWAVMAVIFVLAIFEPPTLKLPGVEGAIVFGALALWTTVLLVARGRD